MSTFQEVKTAIQFEYDSLWNDWFKDSESKSKPELQIERTDDSPENTNLQSCEDKSFISNINNKFSGYVPKNNLLIIRISNKDIQNFGLGFKDKPLWKTELHHEMLHVYQQKGKIKITREGKKLCKKFENVKFLGIMAIIFRFLNNKKGTFGYYDGHNEKFYSAVIEKTKYFNKQNPEDLIKEI